MNRNNKKAVEPQRKQDKHTITLGKKETEEFGECYYLTGPGTYHVRDMIKPMGRYDAASKSWFLPNVSEDDAKFFCRNLNKTLNERKEQEIEERKQGMKDRFQQLRDMKKDLMENGALYEERYQLAKRIHKENNWVLFFDVSTNKGKCTKCKRNIFSVIDVPTSEIHGCPHCNRDFCN